MMENLGTMVDANAKIKEWKEHPDTKKGWIGCKRRSIASALKEFRELNDVSEFFMSYPRQDENRKDDSLEIFYRVQRKLTDTQGFFETRAAFFA